MTAIVMLTGGVGFLSSFLMLRSGLTDMAIRYPLAVVIAYAAFVVCLWIWLRRNRLRGRDERASDETSSSWSIDPGLNLSSKGAGAPETPGFGGGGGFSGGGGGASWSSSSSGMSNLGSRGLAMPTQPPPSGSVGGAGDKGIGLSFDIDDGAVVIIPLIIIGALVLGAVIYVIQLAPILFAEVLLDAAFAAGLYRRLRRADRRHWMQTALRRTIIPAAFVAAMLAAAGAIMQAVYPEATSIGRVWERIVAEK